MDKRVGNFKLFCIPEGKREGSRLMDADLKILAEYVEESRGQSGKRRNPLTAPFLQRRGRHDSHKEQDDHTG